MIGTKLYKGKYTNKEYADLAVWCNANNATVEDKGEYYECVAIPAPTIDELRQAKINEFKNIRDTKEVEPIKYKGSLFDFDEKARDRINSAIIALDLMGENATIEWTTADNTNVTVTANDLRTVIANVAIRSNELHVKYRELKEQIEKCSTKEELDSIKWEDASQME